MELSPILPPGNPAALALVGGARPPRALMEQAHRNG